MGYQRPQFLIVHLHQFLSWHLILGSKTLLIYFHFPDNRFIILIFFVGWLPWDLILEYHANILTFLTHSSIKSISNCFRCKFPVDIFFFLIERRAFNPSGCFMFNSSKDFFFSWRVKSSLICEKRVGFCRDTCKRQGEFQNSTKICIETGMIFSFADYKKTESWKGICYLLWLIVSSRANVFPL